MSEASAVAEAGASGAEGARKGFVARAIGVFVAPGDTFDDIRRRPTVLMPMLLLYVMMVALFYVTYPAQLADQFENAEASGRFDSLSPDQVAQQRALVEGPVVRGISAAGLPLAVIAFFLFFSLIYWGAGHLLGGDPTYKGILSMALFVGLINPVAHFAVKLPLFLSRGTIVGVTFGPAMFMPDLEVTSTLYRALAAFDIFNLWSTVVTGIGIARVSKMSTAAGMTIAIIVFLLGVGLQLAISSLFS